MATGAIHISKKGEPVRCDAKIACTLKTDDPHFDTMRDANIYLEKKNSLEYGEFVTSSKAEENSNAKGETPRKVSNFAMSKDNVKFSMTDEEFRNVHKRQAAALEFFSEKKKPFPEELMNERRDFINEVISRGLALGIDTESKYTFVNAAGEKEYTPERKVLHDKIIAKVLKDAENVPNEGKALWTGGVMAAGKTHILETEKAGLASNYVASLNPDEIKAQMAELGMMPKVRGLTPMEAQSLAHNEASYLTRHLTTILSKQKKNILLDGTLRNYDAVSNVINNMEADGYSKKDSSVIFVEASKDVTIARAQARHKSGLDDYIVRGKGHGGRFVAESAIEGMYEASGKSATLTNAENLLKNGFFTDSEFYRNDGNGIEKIS